MEFKRKNAGVLWEDVEFIRFPYPEVSFYAVRISNADLDVVLLSQSGEGLPVVSRELAPFRVNAGFNQKG